MDAGAGDAGIDAGTDAGHDAGQDSCTWRCDDGGCCDSTIVLRTMAASRPSLAVTTDGTPHVAFLHNSYELQWATLTNGRWQVTPIGVDGGNEYSAAIAIARSGQPVVAYTANYSVRLARLSGTTWTDELVYASAQGFGPFVYGQGAVVDSAGTLQLVLGQEYFQSSTYGSRVTLFSERADGGWGQTGIADYSNNRISEPSLSLVPSGLGVSWLTFYDGRLHVATNARGSWLDREPSPAMCCGNAFSVAGAVGGAFSSAGAPTLALEQADGGWRTLTLSPDGGVGRAGTVVVSPDGGVHALFSHGRELHYRSPDGVERLAPVVSDFMLALDPSGRPHVVFTNEEGLFYWTR